MEDVILASVINDSEPNEFSSPACSLHEVSSSYMGSDKNGDAITDVAVWRKAERVRLIEARKSLSRGDRERCTFAIATALDEIFPEIDGRIVSLYWPFRGEPDLRAWMAAAVLRGATCALPIVVGKEKALAFRTWNTGEALTRGVWDIPIPTGGKEVRPDLIIAPLVGFDTSCYRLGYGGGYYDRTLAGITRPMAVGVGFEHQKLKTIHPLKHDIPMDMIVTDVGVRVR